METSIARSFRSNWWCEIVQALSLKLIMNIPKISEAKEVPWFHKKHYANS
jgi:hypothetical protein